MKMGSGASYRVSSGGTRRQIGHQEAPPPAPSLTSCTPTPGLISLSCARPPTLAGALRTVFTGQSTANNRCQTMRVRHLGDVTRDWRPLLCGWGSDGSRVQDMGPSGNSADAHSWGNRALGLSTGPGPDLYS